MKTQVRGKFQAGSTNGQRTVPSEGTIVPDERF